MPRGKRATAAEDAPVEVVEPVAKSAFDFAQVQGRMKPDSYFEFTAKYPNKEQTMEYLYRSWPKIDRKKLSGDQDKYIEKVPNPFSRTELMRKWGSGDYLLIFNDQRCRGAVKRAECILEIDHPDYPAIIEPGTLDLDHPKNKTYVSNLRGRGELPKEETMGNLSEALLNRALNVIDERESRPAPVAVPSDPLAEIQRIANVAESMGFVRPGAAPGTDAIGEVQRIISVAQMMGFVRPDAGAAAAAVAPATVTTKNSLLADFVPLLREVNVFLSEGLPMIRMLMGGAPGGSTMGNSAQNTGPTQVPNAGQTAIPGSAAPASAGESDETMLPNFGLIQVLQAVAPKALAAFSMQIEGDAFAHGLCKSAMGERQYDALFQFGAEGIMEALQMVPDLDAQLTSMGRDRTQLGTFVTEFVGYGVGESEEAQTGEVGGTGGTAK